MFAIYAAGVNPDDPMSQLVVGELEPGPTPDGWVNVTVRAASLNHHDVFSLTGH
jgi:hypothetical protein